jgi:AcrR family transcriptional regulator
MSSPQVRKTRGQGRPAVESSVGKAALIAAAREALRRKTPGEITFIEIAKIANVDPALIRYYFGQLGDLFVAAAAEISKELRARLAALITRRGTVRERLRARIQVYLGIFRDDPHFHKLCVDGYLSDNENKRILQVLLRQSVEELEELVAEGIGNGELRPVDARFLQIIIGSSCEFLFSAGPIVQAIVGPKAEKADFANRYTQLLIDLVSESPKRSTKSNRHGDANRSGAGQGLRRHRLR